MIRLKQFTKNKTKMPNNTMLTHTIKKLKSVKLNTNLSFKIIKDVNDKVKRHKSNQTKLKNQLFK